MPLNNVGLGELSDVAQRHHFSGHQRTSDPIAPMRVINKFAKQFNGAKFVIKAGFMDGKVLPLDEINALAELPSKEVLQAQVLGTMLAPITSLAIVLKAIAEEKGGSRRGRCRARGRPRRVSIGTHNILTENNF